MSRDGFLTKLVYRYLRPISATVRLLVSRHSYIRTSGWYGSLAAAPPVDQQGLPIPWMNYAFVEFLTPRLSDDLRVFEYGSGQSTLYFAGRVKAVVSVETDTEWIGLLQARLPANCELQQVAANPVAEYCESINSRAELYDMVVVDAINRVPCVTSALQALTERGVVILDDSQRPEYADAFPHAASKGFRELTYSGLKPGTSEAASTTVFYRPGNCLNI